MITLMFVLMIVERRREFATLIAAGAHRRMISRIIIREALDAVQAAESYTTTLLTVGNGLLVAVKN